MTPTSGDVTSEGHSKIDTDPKFVSSEPTQANDVKLQSSSPAIGAGDGLGSDYELILNPASNAFPYGTYNQSSGCSGWMIGAFGYCPP